MYASQFISDAAHTAARLPRGSFGLGPTEEKEPMGRGATLKAALRRMWSLPPSQPITPELRSYPR